MTETRLKELQTEIARLEKIDNAITEKVAAELDNGDELGSAMAWTQEDVNNNLVIECSAELDMQMANESENIQ
jgi:hypothetical protein|tara:strand:- start:40 stop:258 length:219 start_codon:yes stop_codon:yes gene_type:complete